MDITSTLLVPPPGSTAPGNLYADLQSRTLWLGVSTAVDPDGAVLISDIIAMEAEIADVRADGTAYTDAQVALRAPLVHSHTASQITDFTAAVTAVTAGIPALQFTAGMILLWSGSLASIGVGALAGWTLCDGSNGSPDLRDKFILGAGNKVPGSVNSTPSVDTSLAGSHVHTVAGTALSTQQMPAHGHSVSGSFSGSGGTDTHPGHQHGYYSALGGNNNGGGGFQGLPSYQVTDVAGAHSHGVSVSGSISGSAASMGGGQSHTHGMDYAADHKHVITSNALREATPYYALAFIMKL